MKCSEGAGPALLQNDSCNCNTHLVIRISSTRNSGGIGNFPVNLLAGLWIKRKRYSWGGEACLSHVISAVAVGAAPECWCSHPGASLRWVSDAGEPADPSKLSWSLRIYFQFHYECSPSMLQLWVKPGKCFVSKQLFSAWKGNPLQKPHPPPGLHSCERSGPGKERCFCAAQLCV